MSSPLNQPGHARDWSEINARDLRQRKRTGGRVVPMPYLEWFAEQDASYQEEALPHAIRARVCVEAGEEFEITAQRVAHAARASLAGLSATASPMTARGGSHEFPA